MKTLLHRLFSPAVLVLVLVSLTAPALLAASQTSASPAPWRVLVMVYESTDIAEPDQYTANIRDIAQIMPGMWGDLMTGKPAEDSWSPQLSAGARARLDDSLSQLPTLISEWSDGRATITISTVYTGHPLFATGDSQRLGATVEAANVRADIDRYAPNGLYDSIFAVWRNLGPDGPSVTFHAGVAFPSLDKASGAYFASIPLKALFEDQTDLRGFREVFVHEWLHQVIAENHAHGINNVPELHDPTAYGFESVGTWSHWYAAMMDGSLAHRFGVDALSFALPTRGE